MTPTPPGKAGQLTEEIMGHAAGRLLSRDYNRMYSAVYEIMAREFPRNPAVGGRQESPHP
jgi:hypothetical protein